MKGNRWLNFWLPKRLGYRKVKMKFHEPIQKLWIVAWHNLQLLLVKIYQRRCRLKPIWSYRHFWQMLKHELRKNSWKILQGHTRENCDLGISSTNCKKEIIWMPWKAKSSWSQVLNQSWDPPVTICIPITNWDGKRSTSDGKFVFFWTPFNTSTTSWVSKREHKRIKNINIPRVRRKITKDGCHPSASSVHT